MAKGQKIFTRVLWAVLLLAVVGVIAGKFLWKSSPGRPLGQNARPAEPEVLFPAADYKLIDQNGVAFADENLKGKPYIAAFIFTQCPGICPRMTADMSRLQNELPADVHLVSFSVDPARDTPEVLKKYAEAYKADPVRWHFLTGDREAITKVAQDMKLVFKEGSGDHPILHSERLLLIDGNNQVRGTYMGHNPDDVKNLVEDAKYLVNHPNSGAKS